MAFKTFIENKDVLTVWLVLFLVLMIFVYLGFYNDRKTEEIPWYCDSVPSDGLNAQPFDALESSAQAYILEQWENEKEHRIQLFELMKKVNSTEAEKLEELNPGWKKSLIERLRQAANQPLKWEKPKEKYFFCFKQW